MKKPVQFLSPALRDIAEAAKYYLNEAPEAAAALLQEVDRAIDTLYGNPHLGAPAQAGARKHVLQKFPYSVIYRIAADGHVVIVALAHHSRRTYWLKRLK